MSLRIKFNRGGSYMRIEANRPFLLSSKDIDLLAEYSISIMKRGYAICTRRGPAKSTDKTQVYLHHLVSDRIGLDLNGGLIIDHINGDPTDNRRDNLRAIGYSHNISRTKKSWGKSKIKHCVIVNRVKNGPSYRVRLPVKGHGVLHKNCSTPEEAQKFSDEFVKKRNQLLGYFEK